MAEGVDSEVTLDPSFREPMVETELDLASTQWASGPGWEQWIGGHEGCLGDV
jgi:hypothetical protein